MRSSIAEEATSVAVHSSSVVHAKAKVAASVEIGPFCVVGAEVELGEGCVLRSHVNLEGPSIFGSK
ncbi:MAG: hypothetical protein ACEQSM_05455, partial [Aliarcobacter sp.]